MTRDFLKRVYAAVKAGILAYPGGTAAVLGIACAVVARFGLRVTVTELTAIAAVVAAMAGAFVHRTTVSKARPPKSKAPNSKAPNSKAPNSKAGPPKKSQPVAGPSRSTTDRSRP